MKISHNFDSGKIECIDIKSNGKITLSIPKDNASDFHQWFHYRLTGAKDINCSMEIINAGQTSYVEGWENYQAVASYDRQIWFRVDTTFDGQSLTINHTSECDSVYFAYFAPYSMERHRDLIANAQLSELTEHIHLGYTTDGQDMDLLKVGEEGEGKKVCWMIARQHPGETMAQWWMEGMLDSLLDRRGPYLA